MTASAFALFLAIVTVVLFAVGVLRRPRTAPYAILVLAWLTHVVIFLSFVLAGELDYRGLALWSALVVIHAVGALLGAGLYWYKL